MRPDHLHIKTKFENKDRHYGLYLTLRLRKTHKRIIYGDLSGQEPVVSELRIMRKVPDNFEEHKISLEGSPKTLYLLKEQKVSGQKVSRG